MMKTMRSGLRMILAIAGLLASGFGQDELAHQRACDCIEAVCLQENLALLSDFHVRIHVHIIIGHQDEKLNANTDATTVMKCNSTQQLL